MMHNKKEISPEEQALRTAAAAWCAAYKENPALAQPDPILHRYILEQKAKLVGALKNVSASDLHDVFRVKPSLIKHYPDAPDEVQVACVKRLGSVISFIKNPCYAARERAVMQHGTSLQYFTEHTPELERLAVEQSGYAIAFVKQPTEDLQQAAVTKDAGAIRYIQNPSRAVQSLALFRTLTLTRTSLADFDVLMKYTHKFSDEVIDLVRQGLSVALHFVTSDDNAGRLAAIEACLARPSNEAIDLPPEYAGPG